MSMDVLSARVRSFLLSCCSVRYGLILLALLLAFFAPRSANAQEGDGAFVTLHWTATGDDGDTGQAAVYDFRISQNLITEQNWGSATELSGEPLPGQPGMTESFIIEDLQPGVTYYVAMKVGDEIPNWSPLSNNAILLMPETGLDAEFTSFPDSGEAPLVVQFNSGSVGEPTDWEWDFGDGYFSDLPNPQHIYQQTGYYTVRLTVSNVSGAHRRTRPDCIAVSEATNPTDQYAFPGSEATTQGTTEGSYLATFQSDQVLEQLVEELSGGKPELRHSALEHSWTIEVPPSNNLSFNLRASRSSNDEGDDFLFEYSNNGSPFRSLVAVNSDGMSEYTAYMPPDISGTITIRVKDTDRTKSHGNLDVLFVDQMYIETNGSPVLQDTVFVREIEVGQAGRPSKKFCATATVEVTNGRGFAGSGVEVFGHFEGPVGGDASGITESDGRVTLFSDRVRIPEGEWRFIVDSLDGNGRVYSASSNIINSALGLFLLDNLPRSVELYDSYPNPFNPSTTIGFWLPSPGHVRLDVINMLGQQVQTLLDEDRVAGYHSIIWEASHFSSGIYFYRIEADGTVESRKMVLLK